MPGNGGINLTVDNEFIINLKKRYMYIYMDKMSSIETSFNCLKLF